MTVSFPKCNIGNIDFVISMDEKNMRENVHFKILLINSKLLMAF